MTSPSELHPGGFGHVPVAALRDLRLTPIDRAVFASVTSGLGYSNGGGPMRSRRFAERAGVSVRTALGSARKIADLGYWRMDLIPGGCYRFELLPTGDLDRTAAEREEDAAALDPSTTGAMGDRRRRGDGRFDAEGDAPTRRPPRATTPPPSRVQGGVVSRPGGVLPTTRGGAPEGGTPQSSSRATPEFLQLAALRAALFEAVAEVCGIDWHDLTDSARGSLNKAVQQIEARGATPEEVRRRADNWSYTVPLTPPALAKHWPSLGTVRRRRKRDNAAEIAASSQRVREVERAAE